MDCESGYYDEDWAKHVHSFNDPPPPGPSLFKRMPWWHAPVGRRMWALHRTLRYHHGMSATKAWRVAVRLWREYPELGTSKGCAAIARAVRKGEPVTVWPRKVIK